MEFNALLNSLPSCWAMVKVNKIWKEAMSYIDILMEYFELWIVFFFYTGDITSLPAMSLQDQNHRVLLCGAGRCGDPEGWVILSVHLYVNS